MPEYKYRELKPTPEAEATYRRWLSQLNEEFNRHQSFDRRDELYQIYMGRMHGGKTPATLNSELATHVINETLDPHNITLEPEYYGDIDIEKYMLRKPLIWFWLMFDRSPLGMNQWLGLRFRCMLGHHIFKSIGKGVKIFQNVEFSYGYNLTIEDNCTIHRNVLLDDRGEIIIRQGSSISDFANVYSHTHDINTQADVTNKKTEIGPRARLTYHSTVLAGANIGENAMLGAMALATKPVEANVVSVGIPAKVKKQKNTSGQPTERS
jgi:acetyltransferase-like isoleucine patch superfamily enzyme